jgi:hypothetical protein
MAQKAETRGPGQGTRAPICFLLAGWNTAEHAASSHDIQVCRIMRRVRVSPATARAIAELAWQGRAS